MVIKKTINEQTRRKNKVVGGGGGPEWVIQWESD